MKKYFILFFFLSFFNSSLAHDKIIYLDVGILINQSEAGKFINNEIQKMNNANLEEFKNIENSIKADEDKLIKQKNILKEEEFNKNLTVLREKYKSYQLLKKNKNTDLNKLRDNASKEILKILNLILTDYSKKNEISLILDKKNVVIGKSDLDVTQDILKLLNEKITKVELKK
tara:strand:+ start:1397 stop:1915 length:519 start_codon:yes stop_codon:yes gene_type:complete